MSVTTKQMRTMITEIVQALNQQHRDGGGNGSHRNILNIKGWDNLEVFRGGEEKWQLWSWRVKLLPRR